MLKPRIFACLLCACCIALACQAPEPGLTGTVLDGQSQPLPGATVSVIGTDFSALSDAQGKFLLGYEPGDLHIKVEAEGFLGRTVPLNMNKRTRHDMGTLTLKLDVNERAVEQTVLKIVEAQIIYRSTQAPETATYAPDLETLLTHPDNLLKKTYAVPKVGGSEIQFQVGEPDADGRIQAFTVRTRPIQYPRTGKSSFFADENALRKGDNGGKWGSPELPEVE